jgi:hypothetical protein
VPIKGPNAYFTSVLYLVPFKGPNAYFTSVLHLVPFKGPNSYFTSVLHLVPFKGPNAYFTSVLHLVPFEGRNENRVTLRFAFRPLKGTRCRTCIISALFSEVGRVELVTCKNIRVSLATATMTDNQLEITQGRTQCDSILFHPHFQLARTVFHKISHWNDKKSAGTARTALSMSSTLHNGHASRDASTCLILTAHGLGHFIVPKSIYTVFLTARCVQVRDYGSHSYYMKMGHAVAQSGEGLRYKPGGRGFDTILPSSLWTQG